MIQHGSCEHEARVRQMNVVVRIRSLTFSHKLKGLGGLKVQLCIHYHEGGVGADLALGIWSSESGVEKLAFPVNELEARVDPCDKLTRNSATSSRVIST